MDSSLERTKSALTIALGVYPLFVGLYAAGLFWDAPKDALGAFTLTEITFKASVIYTSLAGGGTAYLLATTSIYALISPKASLNSTPAASEQPISWQEFPTKRKVAFLVVSFSILLLTAVSAWIDPPRLSFDPNGFAVVLSVAFVISIVARPIIPDLNWRVAAISYGICWMILGPILMGFQDAQPGRGAPEVVVAKSTCKVVLVGSANLLVKCPNSFALINRDKLPEPLQWTNGNDKRL